MYDDIPACVRKLNLPYDALCSRNRNVLGQYKNASLVVWRRTLATGVRSYVRRISSDGPRADKHSIVRLNDISLRIECKGTERHLFLSRDPNNVTGKQRGDAVSLSDIFTSSDALPLMRDVEDRMVDATNIFGREKPITLLVRTLSNSATSELFHLDETSVLGVNYSPFCTQLAPADAVVNTFHHFWQCYDDNKIGELSEGDVSHMDTKVPHRIYVPKNTPVQARLWIGFHL